MNRNRHRLQMVSNADKFATCNDEKQDIRHEAFMCMSDRSSLELVGCNVKMRKSSEQRKQEVRQASHEEIVEMPFDGAQGGAKMAQGVIGTIAVERRNYACPNWRDVPGVARTLAGWTRISGSGQAVGVF